MRRLQQERGSLPLALLAVIVVSGLVTVIMSSVVSGQRQTRFDQDFEEALQVAEVGLDRMTHLVINHVVNEDSDPADLHLQDTMPGGAYEVEAEHTDGTWVLTATGTARDGTAREIELVLEPDSLFGLAAFGKFFVDFNGGNGADSYRSGTFVDGAFEQDDTGSYICDRGSGARLTDTGSGNSDVLMCEQTGQGVIATNGELDLDGNAFARADAAEVHYASERVDDPLDGATGRCSMPETRCTDPKMSYHREELVLDPDPVDIPGYLDPEGRFPQDFTHEGESNVLPPGELLFTDVRLDEDTVVLGTPDDPTILYMTGQLTIPNHHAVHFEAGPDGHPQPRPSPGFFVFSNSDGGEALSFGNHAAISAAVYAPNAGFAGGAQGNVYGSLIAGSINNNGGWNFHWDEALGDAEQFAPLRPARWSER
jgi:hypothetical protein